MSKNIDTPGIIHNIKAREELNNNGEIAKVKGRVDENPENDFIQHEIKSSFPFSEELNNNAEIAKVKGRVDENPEDDYIQHEIKSSFPFEDNEKLLGENVSSENEQSES